MYADTGAGKFLRHIGEQRFFSQGYAWSLVWRERWRFTSGDLAIISLRGSFCRFHLLT
jgi:hypothetical protein